MNGNRVIVSHISDLDGRIGREMYIYLNGFDVDTPTVWVEYGEMIRNAEDTVEEWAKGKEVAILDFSVTQQFLDKVCSVAESVRLFDHHTGTTKLVEPQNCTIVCDTNESTVSLLWKHFQGAFYIPNLISVCREIDLNLIENVEVLGNKLFLEDIFFKKEKYGHKITNLQLELKELLTERKVPSYLIEEGIQLAQAEGVVEKFAIFDECNRIATYERNEQDRGIDTDIIAHYMLKNKDIDFALISFVLEDKGLKITSVRKLKDTKRDLVAFCQERGGGGRETAGSFSERIEK